MEIPTVDLDDLKSGDATRRAEAAMALRVGYGDFGLVHVRGHGLPPEKIQRLYALWMALLERPADEKATWGGPDIWYQRGWTPPNTEQAVVAGGQPDFKECYFAAPMALDKKCQRWWPQLYCPNVWPERSDEFQALFLEYGQGIHDVGLWLLRGCAWALKVDEDELLAKVEGAAHVTRLLKYLPLAEKQLGTDILWGEEHTDFNLLTLLPGGMFYRDGQPSASGPADGSGLFLRTRPTAAYPHGLRVAGKAPPGCLVSQVGQQLEVLTGGRFLATPHVITAPGETGWARTSLAHFIHLRGDVAVAPLDRFVDEAGDRYAPPVLAGTYGMKTLIDIGLAPRSELDKLGYRAYDRLANIRAVEDQG